MVLITFTNKVAYKRLTIINIKVLTFGAEQAQAQQETLSPLLRR